MASDLNLFHCNRKYWLVRVPNRVAQQWRESIERAKGFPVAAAPEETAHLGQITLEDGQATTLLIDQPGSDEQVVLHMNSNRDTVHTAILSWDPTAEPAPKPEPAAAATGAGAAKAAAAAALNPIQLPVAEGVAFKRFDAAPIKFADVSQADLSGLDPEQVKQEAEQRQRAALQADSTYLHNSRKRLGAAPKSGQPHKYVLLQDMKEMMKLAGGKEHQPVYTKRRVTERTATAEVKRRVRMGRDELEAELFKKFADQPHWHFVQLQKELDQPVSYLKEVLNEVASQVKRGPNKDLWELKKHLVTGSTAQQ